jgi:Flavin containing amine oxidoreductase
MADADIIVVGAGLAGLRAAGVLTAAGREVVLLEAADGVGGRVRSARHGDFVVDQGFQLLNPSYPALLASGVLADLPLAPLPTTVVVRKDGRDRVIGDPRRDLMGGLRSLSSGLLRWSDVRPTLVTGWRLGVGRRPRLRATNLDTRAGLRDAGFSNTLREDVWRPFLRGVLLDEELDTSWEYTQLVLRSFLLGRPSTVVGGIATLAAAFRARTSAHIRFTEPVRAVTPTSVTTDFATYRARHVIVATDGQTASTWGLAEPPRWHGVTTWWWSTPAFDDGRLRLDRDGGRLLNAVAMSVAVPSHAPENRTLIAASSLTTDLADAIVGSDVARLYGFVPSDLDLVTVTRVPRALPHVARVPSEPFRVVRDIVVVGDHVATPSIQGALASGAAAARAILSGDAGARAPH